MFDFLSFYAIFTLENKIKRDNVPSSIICPGFLFVKDYIVFGGIMIDLKSLLSEEKALGKNPYFSYKVSTLEEINSEILQMKKVEAKESLRQDAITMEYENPESIVLTFVAGRINLLMNPHEAQVRLNNLMNTFHEKRNYTCAEYIASIILEAGDSQDALIVLGEIAKSNGEDDKMWSYYERYVRCNSKDTDYIAKVASNYEKIGDKKNAKVYYQRTLNRLLSANDSVKTREIFKALLDNGSSDFSFYSTYIAKLGFSSLALDLSKMLLSYLMEMKNSFTPETAPSSRRKTFENIIDVARNILTIDKDDAETKELLSNILKEKYGSSSRYNEVNKKFDVTKASDPVKALEEFEKNIAYSKNTFVIQNATKKVGLITDVTKDGILNVKFSNRPGDEVKISVVNAMVSLRALSNQDIKAIKKGKKAEVIKNKIYSEGGYEWLLKTLLFSSQNKTATLKEMKDEVVPSILTDKEWDTVSKTIKSIALIDPYIDVINKSTYHLRDYPSTMEERTYETFLGYKDFGKRVSTLLEASEIEGIDLKSDSFLDMVRYFSDYIKDEKNDIPTRIEALLVVESMGEKGVPVASEVSFDDLYKNLDLNQKKEVYENLSCKDSKKTYVDLVSQTDKNAYDVLEAIFPTNPTKELMRKMQNVNPKKYQAYVSRCLNNYKENGIAFGAFVESGIKAEDLKNAKIKEDEFVLTELNALSSVSRGVGVDERQIKSLRSDLIERNRLKSFISSAKEPELKMIAPHLVWNQGLSSDERETFKAQILSRFPSFDFKEKQEEEEKPVEISVHRGFMCTKKSFDRKQAELIDIKENQIPHTLHEIKTARELGDLRENSEYQYAKDHKVFLDREYERLANELSSVKIMSMTDVLDGRVGFGTKVRILNTKDNSEITYTFFGRWESDPDNNIIDINAPIGEALINHQVGETVDYTLGSNSFSYKILSIEKVEF